MRAMVLLPLFALFACQPAERDRMVYENDDEAVELDAGCDDYEDFVVTGQWSTDEALFLNVVFEKGYADCSTGSAELPLRFGFADRSNTFFDELPADAVPVDQRKVVQDALGEVWRVAPMFDSGLYAEFNAPVILEINDMNGARVGVFLLGDSSPPAAFR
jgi:hypothetical protein